MCARRCWRPPAGSTCESEPLPVKYRPRRQQRSTAGAQSAVTNLVESLDSGSHLALVGPWPPYRGGIAHFTAQMGLALEGRGHRVSAVSFSRQYPQSLFPGKSQIDPQATASTDAPRLIDSINPRSWWQTAAYLLDLRPDALVFQYWMPFFAPALGTIARRVQYGNGARPRRVAVVHNALPHERRPGDRQLGRYFLGTCDGLVALSANVRADLEGLVPAVPVVEGSHPVYSQFGPRLERRQARLALGLDPDDPVLLFFGFVRRYKGLDVLLDALPVIAERHPRVKVIVAGEFYEPEAPYREQIARLGLGDQVRIENRYVPDAEVPVLFGAADAVVQPYRSATQSGVAQVAFGMGVPVITTAVGGLAEAVPHERAGLVVPPEDPVALAAAASRLLGDPGLAERLGQGAFAEASSQGWEVICEAVEGFLRNPPGHA